MPKTIFMREDDLLIKQMWDIVFRALGKNIDDAGCDWFTIGNQTFIDNTEWHVSDIPDVAKLVNAINCLHGYPDLIYSDFESCDRKPVEEVEE